MSNVMIARLQAERTKHIEFIDQTLARAESEKRDLVDTETTTLNSTRERIAELDAQIKPLEDFEQLRGAHRTGGFVPAGAGTEGGETRSLGGAITQPREFEYRSAGQFLADGYRARQRGDQDAAARLETHGVGFDSDGTMTRAVAPHNTTAEVPGLLPVPIIGPIMSDIDAARPFVSSIGAKDLGGIAGTTFKRPTVTEHVQVGKQAAEKDELTDGQLKIGSIDFTKETYGGWANVSRQNIDWTSPAVWDALMSDFIEQYGLQTENAAADAFATAVVATEELTTASGGNPTMAELVTALYGAAVKAYQGSGRLPDHIWASLDWWPKLGALIDTLKATTNGNGGGDSDITRFAGNLLNVPRSIVPSFPASTLIVGVKSRTEVYEDRIGFLTAVQPKVLGVELAYGGYMANGTIKPAAFCKVVNLV